MGKKESELERGHAPKVKWPLWQEDKIRWAHDPIEPKIPAKEYALLIAAYHAEGPVKWTELTDALKCHYTKANEPLRRAQGKGYIRRATGPEVKPKLYELAARGRELLTKRKSLWKSVQKKRMGREHFDMMIEGIKDTIHEGCHSWADYHATGKGMPDLVATPIVRGAEYDLEHQFAYEFETNPPNNSKKIQHHFRRNCDRGWPTVWQPYHKRHEEKLKETLVEAGANLVQYKGSPLNSFNWPDDALVVSGWEFLGSVEGMVQKYEKSLEVLKALRDGKRAYANKRGYARVYNPGSGKQHAVGYVNNYALRAIRGEDTDYTGLIRGANDDLDSHRIVERLCDGMEDGERVWFKKGYVYVGKVRVCKADKKVWDDTDRRWRTVEDMVVCLKHRKERAKQTGKTWRPFTGLPS